MHNVYIFIPLTKTSTKQSPNLDHKKLLREPLISLETKYLVYALSLSSKRKDF